MYKLHGFSQSGNTYKVALMLQALQLPWTAHHVPLADFAAGLTRSEPWRQAENEMGEVPILEVDGRRLTQSAAILLFLAERGEHGQADRLVVVAFGLREVASRKPRAPVVGLQVHRDVVHVDADALATQRIEYGPAPLRIDTDHVEVKRRVRVRSLQGLDQRKVLQGRVVALRQLMPTLHVTMQPRQLAQAQRGVQFGHAVVEAEIDLFVVPRPIRRAFHRCRLARDAVAAQQRHAFSELAVVRQRHAAFGAGDDLHRVEAEHDDVAVARVTDRPALITAADGMRCILDDAKAVLPREPVDRLHLATLPGKVDRHDDLRQPTFAAGGLQLLRERLHRHVVRPCIDVDRSAYELSGRYEKVRWSRRWSSLRARIPAGVWLAMVVAFLVGVAATSLGVMLEPSLARAATLEGPHAPLDHE